MSERVWKTAGGTLAARDPMSMRSLAWTAGILLIALATVLATPGCKSKSNSGCSSGCKETCAQNGGRCTSQSGNMCTCQRYRETSERPPLDGTIGGEALPVEGMVPNGADISGGPLYCPGSPQESGLVLALSDSASCRYKVFEFAPVWNVEEWVLLKEQLDQWDDLASDFPEAMWLDGWSVEAFESKNQSGEK